jgi:hypothetical protein
MHQYRLYTLDGVGKISRAETIEAESDEDAIMIARAAKKPVRCELWQNTRLIATIPASAS